MNIHRIDLGDKTLSVTDPLWDSIPEVSVENDWMGIRSLPQRFFRFQLCWSDRFFSIRFITTRNDECVIGSNPRRDSKTLELWNRDVCEIFIAPNPSIPEEYFEFEIAPTGEWVDLQISVRGSERFTDSDIKTHAFYEAISHNGIDLMMISIPWATLGVKPSPGVVMRGNVYRCTGSEPRRGYLALWPTKSPVPNFHVPESFGEFRIND
jgi:hypothetical protein